MFNGTLEENLLLLLQFGYVVMVGALFAWFMVSTGAVPEALNNQMYVVVFFLFGKEALATWRGLRNGTSSLIVRGAHKEE